MPKVTLMINARQAGKWRFFRASLSGNGRVEPGVAIVNDRRRTFDSGNYGGYFIRYTRPDGKQTYVACRQRPCWGESKADCQAGGTGRQESGSQGQCRGPGPKQSPTSSCRFDRRIQQLHKRQQTPENLDGV